MGVLDDIHGQVRRAIQMPGLNRLALGFPDLDGLAWQYGRRRLDAIGLAGDVGAGGRATDGPDVYLATRLYRDGGHTALIGDFVRARAGRANGVHLIVTNATWEGAPLTPEIRVRTGMAADDVTEILAGTFEERFDQVARRLAELRPARLFLFHHPDDPIAVAAAHPVLSGRCVLVHHSDATPSLGLHIPGVAIVELNPSAGAMARAQRLDPALLLLTCPDPGPLPRSFLQRGRLTTASSGAQWKFQGEHPCTYAEAVSLVLRTTGGRHVHIGPLDEAMRAGIRATMTRQGVDPDSFEHIEWVPSLAAALNEIGCDVFLASFPVDGARTLIEVAASGTPYLTRSRRVQADMNDPLGLPGAATWHAPEDLPRVLATLADASALAERSSAGRDWYRRFHHPEVFSDTLADILAGRGGLHDPAASQRDAAALAHIVERLVDTALSPSGVSMDDLASAEGRLLRAIDSLDGRVRSIEGSANVAARRPWRRGLPRRALGRLRRMLGG